MSGVLVHVPGHGGEDPGCTWDGGKESDWALAMALDCESGIRQWGVEQHFTRRRDINTDPRGEAQFAAERGAHLAILHHVNASSDPHVDGMMVFALNSDPWAISIGDAIMRAAPARLRRKSPKATLTHHGDQDWPRVFNCLKYFTCSAILIEYGFSTSPIDLPILLDPTCRPALQASVLVGVARMLELLHGGQ